MLLHQRQQFCQSERCQIDIGGWKVKVLDATKMRLRQPPIARYGVNESVPSQRSQSDDGIHRAQPGAKQYDGAAGSGEPGIPVLPGIANPSRMVAQLRASGEPGRGFVPRRQYDVLRLDATAVGQMNHRAVALRRYVQGLALDKSRVHADGIGGDCKCCCIRPQR